MKCEIIAENRLTYAVLDKYPVNKGHIIPRYKVQEVALEALKEP